MNIKEIKEAFDLDIIVNNVLDNDNITPEFVRECQKAAMCKVSEFAAKITNKYGIELTELVEDQAGGLLDSICDVNYIYFKNGMAAGAVLLLQLLGF